MLMNIAALLIFLNGEPISFAGRDYLRAIYDCTAGRVVLSCSRQVEKSTTLAILAITECMLWPHTTVLVVLPRQEQLRVFRDRYLVPLLKESPGVASYLLRKGSRITGTQIVFVNGAAIFLRSCYNTPDSGRGISASMLILDEYQDVAPGTLEILEQALSHSSRPRVVVAGTPKMDGNPLAEAFNRCRRHVWSTKCGNCGEVNAPTMETLGGQGTVCANCGFAIDFKKGF